MGKKRRCEVVGDLDAERTLYSSFVTAANAMSQLYSQAVQQQRKSATAASRQTLERVLTFILREHTHADAIPKTALLQFLQQEYESLEGSESLPQQFPVQLLPTLNQAPITPSSVMDEQTSPEVPHMKHSSGRVAANLVSPVAKRTNSGQQQQSSSMDTAEHEPHRQAQGPGHPCNPAPMSYNNSFAVPSAHEHAAGFQQAPALGIAHCNITQLPMHQGPNKGAMFVQGVSFNGSC